MSFTPLDTQNKIKQGKTETRVDNDRSKQCKDFFETRDLEIIVLRTSNYNFYYV